MKTGKGGTSFTLTVSILIIFIIAGIIYNFRDEITGKVVSDRSLVAHWNFDKESSIVEYDISGDRNHLNLVDGAHTIEYDKPRGNVLLLDGIDDYAFAGDSIKLDLANMFTLSAWVNSENSDSIGSIFSKEEEGSETEGAYNLYVAKNLFGYRVNKNNLLEVGGISLGEWNHIAITYDVFSDPNLKMYVNGNLVNSGNIVEPHGNREDLLIGKRGYSSGQYKSSYFRGMMDELRIYNRVLSEKEIKELSTTYQ